MILAIILPSNTVMPVVIMQLGNDTIADDLRSARCG